MNVRRSVVFVVLCSSVASWAVAADPLEAWARGRVQVELLTPLTQKEANRPRFSRALPPPAERRVRILFTTTLRDARGRSFVPYATDARHGERWSESYRGCVYEKTGQVLVSVGPEYRPAAYLLGKNVEPVPGACEVAPSKS